MLVYLESGYRVTCSSIPAGRAAGQVLPLRLRSHLSGWKPVTPGTCHSG